MKLLELLQKLHLNDADFNNLFHEIADQLMNHHVIAAPSGHFRITGLEFYVYTPDHEDTFTRKVTEEQHTPWRFIADVNDEKLTRKSFTGLNIELSSGGKITGHILLCGLEKVDDKEVTAVGAKASVDLLLQHLAAEAQAEELLKVLNSGPDSLEMHLQLIPYDHAAKRELREDKPAQKETDDAQIPEGDQIRGRFYRDLLYKYILNAN